MQKKRVERLAREHGLAQPGLFANGERGEVLDYSEIHDFVRELWSINPMATAPKDGREVLLKVVMRAGIPNKWLVGHYMQGGHCIKDHPPIDQGWYFFNGCMFDKASEPIGWMYMPDDEKE